jgi:hypothetical protein
MLFSIIFTTVFLTVNFHLHSTFASPTKGSVAPRHSLNLTHSLAKREYVPADQACAAPEEWVYRNCVSEISDREWLDTCDDNEGNPYWVYGRCPEDKICMDTYSIPPDSIPTISCIDRPTQKDETQQAPKKMQTGVIAVGKPFQPGSTSHIQSVPIVQAMQGASITALLEGTY